LGQTVSPPPHPSFHVTQSKMRNSCAGGGDPTRSDLLQAQPRDTRDSALPVPSAWNTSPSGVYRFPRRSGQREMSPPVPSPAAIALRPPLALVTNTFYVWCAAPGRLAFCPCPLLCPSPAPSPTFGRHPAEGQIFSRYPAERPPSRRAA
jgi:hypothetical protein